MVHLHETPDDVLSLILRELHQPLSWSPSRHPRVKYLYNLALASKPLLDRTQEVMYEAFWTFNESDTWRPDGTKTWRIRSFLLTLIAQPALATHVRRLNLPHWMAWDRSSDEFDGHQDCAACNKKRNGRYSLAQNHKDRILFQKAIKGLALTDKKAWKEAVRKNLDEVYLALLLLILPNLKELDILVPCNPVFLNKAMDHATMIRPAESQFPSLQRLQRVTYQCRGNLSYMDINHAAPFFRLPAIESLHLGWVTSTSPWPIKIQNSSLKYLELCHADVDTSIFHNLLQNLPNLETFKYEHYRSLVTPKHILRFNELTEALLNVESSLRDLKIEPLSLSSGKPGSLRSLQRLQRLDTPMSNFLRFDGREEHLYNLLPSSLEVLEFQFLRQNPNSTRDTSIILQIGLACTGGAVGGAKAEENIVFGKYEARS